MIVVGSGGYCGTSSIGYERRFCRSVKVLLGTFFVS
jgi:hypothetical protein